MIVIIIYCVYSRAVQRFDRFAYWNFDLYRFGVS
jgi:hypothetical protein